MNETTSGDGYQLHGRPYSPYPLSWEKWFADWRKAQIKYWVMECIAIGTAGFGIGLLIGGLFL